MPILGEDHRTNSFRIVSEYGPSKKVNGTNKVNLEGHQDLQKHLENWLNNNADKTTWAKVYYIVDRGGFDSEGGHCVGTSDQVISWGGPIATFRWDSATDVDFKFLGIREIQPPD